jgi:hypothetical protein
MDKTNFTLTQKCFLQVFEFKDGFLYWKTPLKFSKMKPGDKAGRLVTDGHLQTCVAGNRLYNHRIIFMMVHGYMPEQVDHIDCNPLNNQIHNLRPATNCENLKNRRLFKSNKSGVKGVIWHKKSKKWMGYVSNNSIRKTLGMFDTIEEAEKVVKSFREQSHGEFARHS